MQTIGQKLKKVRQDKGLSLEDAQRATKIQCYILQSFEEDNFNKDGIAIYTKSLLRLYAKFLGLEPNEIAKEAGFVDNAIKERNILQRLEQEQDIRKKRAIKLPTFNFKLPKLNRKVVFFILIGVCVYISIFMLVRSLKNRAEKIVQNKETTVNPTKSTKKEDVKVVKIQEQKIGSLQLGIRAKSDCWLKVTIDGQVLFRGILKKNAVEKWQAKENIQLAVADASRLEIEVNGKIIGPLGRKGQALKNITITREGVSAAE